MESIRFQGAILKLPGVTILCVAVGMKLFKNAPESTRMLRRYSVAYNNIPVLLVAVDETGKTHYRGLVQHKELVIAMKDVPASQLSFQEHTVFLDQ